MKTVPPFLEDCSSQGNVAHWNHTRGCGERCTSVERSLLGMLLDTVWHLEYNWLWNWVQHWQRVSGGSRDVRLLSLSSKAHVVVQAAAVHLLVAAQLFLAPVAVGRRVAIWQERDQVVPGVHVPSPNWMVLLLFPAPAVL